MKCIVCKNEDIEVIEENEKEYYCCQNGHKEPRMIENEGLENYKKSGEIVHKSVGAILEKNNKIVLLKRRKYPFKFTIPAGHLENGEKPAKAVLREIKEETRLKIDEVEKIFEGEIKDPCRRGADYHYWYLFKAQVEEQESIRLNDEASDYKLLEPEKLHSMDLTMPTETLLVDKSLI